jgi:xylan 1,4-beta-xylosidase
MEIRDLPPSSAFEMDTLDATHGFCLAAWKEIGSPEPPSREQAQLLRKAAMGLKREVLKADSSGTLRLDLTLEPWAILMLRESRDV